MFLCHYENLKSLLFILFLLARVLGNFNNREGQLSYFSRVKTKFVVGFSFVAFALGNIRQLSLIGYFCCMQGNQFKTS
jgi:hypothetical protein